MEQDNKYYIPEIEEFHIGFAYEYLTNGDDWIKHTISCKTDLIECILDLEENNIRVKYLDREDIESFGFVEEIFKSENVTYLKKDSCVIIIDNLVKNLFIGLIDPYAVPPKKYIALFNGTIKNKSELKRILKQLDIIK